MSGTISRAVCKCGYVSGTLYEGFSIKTLKYLDLGVCASCKEIININRNDTSYTCPICNNKCFMLTKTSIVYKGNKYKYCCPKCNKANMVLEGCGIWD